MRLFSIRWLPLRWKMTLAALTPLVVVLLIVAISAAWIIRAWVVDEAQQRVRNDLNAAREVYLNELGRIEDVLRLTANSTSVAPSIASIREDLPEIRRREKLDLLNYVDIKNDFSTFAVDAPPARSYLADQARQGKVFSGTFLLDANDMDREDPALTNSARISLHPVPPSNKIETRGLFLLSAAPVRNAVGDIVGCLYGGVLLNNNLQLVDHIRNVIFGEGNGSATIFIDRIRAATTIRLDNDDRAIGTSISDEVANAVLGQGKTWLARAYVVDQWYLTAYEPILDYRGEAIGVLYVGLLEAPFMQLKQKATLLLLGLLTLGCSIGYLLAHYVARRIAQPILRLEDSAHRIAAGERDVQLPETDDDEVGRLASSFKHMMTALRENEEELNRLNRNLERKVFERTSELEEKSLKLMRTQQELLRAEKLAAIGELASGVAHEINNPAAIIRGNIELLLTQLEEGHPAREEAIEVLKQTERMSRITQNMLTFAREQSIELEQVSVNEIINEVLCQVEHQEPTQEITISTNLDTNVPSILADGDRLRQVFTNIIVNSLQALNGQGALKIFSRLEGDGVEVRFEDNGPGFSKEVKEKIFNPFFTTKSSGTGLGLSVSYGIIKALKGRISAHSEPGQGATFTIFLPRG